MFEPEPVSKKKGRIVRRLWLLLIPAALSVAAYLYGPRLYYQFSDDPIVRLRRRAEAFESRMISKKHSAEDQYKYLLKTREMLEIIEKDSPAIPDIHYYHGLFNFYELVLRLSLDSSRLLLTAGRGILPGHRELQGIEGVSIADLSRQCSLRMRKVLALDPEFGNAPTAHLIIAYGDLLHTARTDPVLLKHLSRAKETGLSRALLPYHDWIALGLYAFLGRKEELERTADRIEKENSKTPGLRMSINKAELNMVLGFGAFNTRDFLRALRLARSVKKDESASVAVRVEAVRMEGEIFLVQRGPRTALDYFKEALKLAGGNDPYLKKRIAELSESK